MGYLGDARACAVPAINHGAVSRLRELSASPSVAQSMSNAQAPVGILLRMRIGEKVKHDVQMLVGVTVSRPWRDHMMLFLYRSERILLLPSFASRN